MIIYILCLRSRACAILCGLTDILLLRLNCFDNLERFFAVLDVVGDEINPSKILLVMSFDFIHQIFCGALRNVMCSAAALIGNFSLRGLAVLVWTNIAAVLAVFN